jgi:hypothetical protein
VADNTQQIAAILIPLGPGQTLEIDGQKRTYTDDKRDPSGTGTKTIEESTQGGRRFKRTIQTFEKGKLREQHIEEWEWDKTEKKWMNKKDGRPWGLRDPQTSLPTIPTPPEYVSLINPNGSLTQIMSSTDSGGNFLGATEYTDAKDGSVTNISISTASDGTAVYVCTTKAPGNTGTVEQTMDAYSPDGVTLISSVKTWVWTTDSGSGHWVVTPASSTPSANVPPALMLPFGGSTGQVGNNGQQSPVDTAYLLVPFTPSRSGATLTNSKIEIVVPPEVLNTPVTTPPSEPFTLRFTPLTGPVDVELDAKTPQDVSHFLDYVESGAFNDELFHRLALGALGGSTAPAVSHATVNTDGSLTLTGGTAVTLLPTTPTNPSSLVFEFDTPAGLAFVDLKGAKAPLTAADFMVAIETGAIDAALAQRLSSAPQTGSSLPARLQASITNACINLTGDTTGSSETILMPDGTIVTVPPVPSAGTSPIFQFNTPSGSVDVTILNDVAAQTMNQFTNYLESTGYVGSDLQIKVISAAGQATVSSALVALSSNETLPIMIQGLPGSAPTSGSSGGLIGGGLSGGGTGAISFSNTTDNKDVAQIIVWVERWIDLSTTPWYKLGWLDRRGFGAINIEDVEKHIRDLLQKLKDAAAQAAANLAAAPDSQTAKDAANAANTALAEGTAAAESIGVSLTPPTTPAPGK